MNLISVRGMWAGVAIGGFFRLVARKGSGKGFGRRMCSSIAASGLLGEMAVSDEVVAIVVTLIYPLICHGLASQSVPFRSSSCFLPANHLPPSPPYSSYGYV